MSAQVAPWYVEDDNTATPIMKILPVSPPQIKDPGAAQVIRENAVSWNKNSWEVI